MSPKKQITKNVVGPYPKTEQERIKAARKYNLIPEDYEPYPENEGFGDYPKLKPVGDFNRNRYDDCDDPDDHRFYGEPLQREFDMYKWERIDPLLWEKPRYLENFWVRLLLFLTTPTIIIGGCLLASKNRIFFNHPFKIHLDNRESRYSFRPSPIDGLAPHTSHGH